MGELVPRSRRHNPTWLYRSFLIGGRALTAGEHMRLRYELWRSARWVDREYEYD